MARLDAQLLLLFALSKSAHERAWLLTHDDTLVEDGAALAYQRLCERRASGEPVAYIVGYKEFFGLMLKVDPRVLVPRPDTETLVQWLLDLVRTDGAETSRILDLGTGSGAIALAVAAQLKQDEKPASVLAVDASGDALAVASENGRRLGLQCEVQFLQSDWFENVDGRFGFVVSNPPYIARGDPHLPALAHEPVQALVSEDDGLADIARIVHDAPPFLEPDGWLLLEHGYQQAARVRQALTSRGFVSVQSRCDLAGHERCSGGRWPQVSLAG